jgi:hypothetical protein
MIPTRHYPSWSEPRWSPAAVAGQDSSKQEAKMNNLNRPRMTDDVSPRSLHLFERASRALSAVADKSRELGAIYLVGFDLDLVDHRT